MIPDLNREGEVGLGLIGCGGMGLIIPRLIQKREKRVKTQALCDPEPRSLAAGLKQLNRRARATALARYVWDTDLFAQRYLQSL